MTTVIRPIPAEQTHTLRQRVLRPNQRLDELVYPGDGEHTTFHLGAITAQNQVVGIGSFYLAKHPLEPQKGDWRLRGMAVDPRWQNQGVGQRLVGEGTKAVGERGGTRLWCNARVTAMGFYEKLGFVTQGQAFDIPKVGPHYVMSVAVHPPPR